MEFVLVGQPNSGKSTIFNSVVGFRSMTSNFPGVTVTYTCGEIYCEDENITVTDIPGTYSLHATDEAELEAVSYIYNLPEDSVLINIVDASVLSRSLELTLQIMELKRPMVVVLNMMDEAEKKGIEISREALQKKLNIPVVFSVACKGIGISDIFTEAYRAGKEYVLPADIAGPKDVEDVINKIQGLLKKKKHHGIWSNRFIAIKLLEHDLVIETLLSGFLSQSDRKLIHDLTSALEKSHDIKSHHIISSMRHDCAFTIFEATSTVKKSDKVDFRSRIDSVLMHPVLGYLFLAAILYSSFWVVTSISEVIEPVITGAFEVLAGRSIDILPSLPFMAPIAIGFFHGLGGGISIAVSFLVPFFLFLAFLEDTGYLSRIAFLMDNLMHRIGLHGMSVVPLILGYGCNVPAIFATKILKSPRDRFITATLATIVPCSARMVIILGLVGALFSMKAVVIVYLLNILVMGIMGKIMSAAMPVVSPGLLMVVPRYQMPGLKTLAGKTWLRMKEFIFMAIPLLIAGSIVLELINHYGIGRHINGFLSPFTAGLLGLPVATGVVLLFGIMRKELALLLLLAAMGAHTTQDLLVVMTPGQIYSFTIFASFYIPCLATVGAITRVFNWRKALVISLLTFLIAIVLTLGVRGIFLVINT